MRKESKPKPKMRISDIIRYKGEDIVKVLLEDGTVQPFHRGSSGMWLNFEFMDGGSFISKWRFGIPEGERITQGLEIFGSYQMRDLSVQLSGMRLREGREVKTQKEVNEFIGMEGIAVDSDPYDKAY